jgi:acetyl-CoA carboxylase carboxyl transferase subunit beta
MDLRENLYVCPSCAYHHRIGSADYFEILFDEGTEQELFAEVVSKDMLEFVDLKPYHKRLDETYAKTNLHDSMTVAHGQVDGQHLVVACMDFDFIGGSLGSVMGEKISRACDYCLQHRIPFMIINKSGGARMMESAFSLMQLAKTSGKLSLLADAKIPYISLCTDPTFGGTTASFAMLGDIICGEPGALIGFAGPRVIKETIKRDLPEGFQRSEFLLEHGFLDFIVPRKELKAKISQLLDLFNH